MKRNVGLLVGTLLVVTAACSSGGSKALSKDDFLKQGNQICKDGNDAIDAGSKKAFPNQTQQPDPETLKKFFDDTIAPNVKKQIDGIAGLKPPKELESAVSKLVTDARAKLAQLQAQVDKDPSSLFSSSEDPFADINKQANNIGLTTCGQSGNGGGSSS